MGKDKEVKLDVTMVSLYSPPGSRHLSLEVGDIVDTIDDTYILARQAFPLWWVDSIEAERNQMILKRKQPKFTESMGMDSTENPTLPRWGQKKEGIFARGLGLCDDNAVIIKEGDTSVEGKKNWFNLGME